MSKRDKTTMTQPKAIIGVQVTPDGVLMPAITTSERRQLNARINDLQFRMDTLDALKNLQYIALQIDLLAIYAPRGQLKALLYDSDMAAQLAYCWTAFIQRAPHLIANFEAAYAEDSQRILERYEALKAGDIDRLLTAIGTNPGQLGEMARDVQAKATQGRGADPVVTRWCEYAARFRNDLKPRPTWANADKALRSYLENDGVVDDIDRAILGELQYMPDGLRLKKHYEGRNKQQ